MFPGVFDLWLQRPSSHSSIIPSATTFVRPAILVPSVDAVVDLIHKNILDVIFPATVTTNNTKIDLSQECSKSVTAFNILYRSIDNAFSHLNLFVHDIGERYPSLMFGTIRHIRKYKSREARMRRAEAILPPVECRRTENIDINVKNHVATKYGDSKDSSFRSKIADRHRAWQQVRNNFGFDKSNVTSEF